MIKVERPEDDLAIQLYRVSVKNGSPDQVCTIMACIPPLSCQINNLTRGANHTFEVKACVPGNDVCSTSTEQILTLKPNGEYYP